MEYQIQRVIKVWPDSLAELQQYVQEAASLLTDLAQSEGMSDWVSFPKSMEIFQFQLRTGPRHCAARSCPASPDMPWVVVLLILIVGQFLGLLQFCS